MERQSDSAPFRSPMPCRTSARIKDELNGIAGNGHTQTRNLFKMLPIIMGRPLMTALHTRGHIAERLEFDERLEIGPAHFVVRLLDAKTALTASK